MYTKKHFSIFYKSLSTPSQPLPNRDVRALPTLILIPVLSVFTIEKKKV